MRYGGSMLQVVRVHPEPVEGLHRVSTVDSKRVVRRAHHERIWGTLISIHCHSCAGRNPELLLVMNIF